MTTNNLHTSTNTILKNPHHTIWLAVQKLKTWLSCLLWHKAWKQIKPILQLPGPTENINKRNSHLSYHKKVTKLPIRQRILFKTAVLVYKCWHGMAPSYLSTYCMPNSSHDGWCHLRSAVSGQLTVPRTTTNYADRSFAVSGPAVWNSLPAAFRQDMLLSVFRRRLKTFLMT